MRARCLTTFPALSLALASPLQAEEMPQSAGGKEALEILTQTIEVPTVKGRGKVPDLAAMLERRLIAGGFAAEDIAFTPLGETGYLTARYPGSDSEAGPLVILVHMDVVEAKPEDWERDPFAAVIEDGYIFGRGSVDNKADLVMAMAALFTLKREGFRPVRDIVLLATGDEETDMATARAAAETLGHASLVLNGDGGEAELAEDGTPIVYKIQAAEKTYADFRLTAVDAGGHSSRPDDSNPIADIAAAVRAIVDHPFAPELSPITRLYWEATAERAPGEVAAAMRAFAADPSDLEAADRLSSDPEYIGVVRTTCVPTQVAGGHAPNALPQSASVTINCRIFPSATRVQTLERLRQIVGNPNIAFEIIDDGSIEAPASPLLPEVLAAVEKAVHQRAPGLPITPAMEAGATDSMFFRAKGIPAFGVSAVFMKPTDDYTHGLNERLPIATLDPGVRQWEVLLRELAD